MKHLRSDVKHDENEDENGQDIEWRRDAVMKYGNQGYTQREIARVTAKSRNNKQGFAVFEATV